MTEAPLRSGNPWIDALFDWCVQVLLWLAHLFGVSYNEINVWIFCVIWPVATVVLVGVVIWQRIKIRKLTKDLKRL